MASFNNNNNGQQFDSLRVPLYPHVTSKGNKVLKGYQEIGGAIYQITVTDSMKSGVKYENIAYLKKFKANQKNSKALPL